MTGDEIFNLAKKNVALPEESTLSEQLMFGISRNICKAFKDGLIDEQQARIEKNKAIQTFGTQQLSERIYKIYGERWNEVMNILSQARKGFVSVYGTLFSDDVQRGSGGVRPLCCLKSDTLIEEVNKNA